MNETNQREVVTSINNSSTFQLEKYLERIGYTGLPVADLETLQTIHRLHTSSIPFENLNPLLHWAVKLDVESLQEKIVNNKRGGYCFEHNILLSEALREIGFEVCWLGARVLWNRPEGTVNARSHMLLQVTVNGEQFIADAGFGGLTLTAALKLQAGVEQATPHEPFRLIQKGEEYTLEAKVREEWKPLYFFSLQEQVIKDYEVMSWYLCNHPESHFIKMLRAAITGPGVRYALNNNEFAVHRMNNGTERNILATPEEVMDVLQNVFLIDLPDTPELTIAIKQVMEHAVN
jgi:N-hydroxyarylamine O-acetyltransferase